jgi:hypothetical protein
MFLPRHTSFFALAFPTQAAIDWALAQLPPTTAQRFATYGQQLLTAPDLQAVCPGGPCWIWDPLRFDKDDANATVADMKLSLVLFPMALALAHGFS